MVAATRGGDEDRREEGFWEGGNNNGLEAMFSKEGSQREREREDEACRGGTGEERHSGREARKDGEM